MELSLARVAILIDDGLYAEALVQVLRCRIASDIRLNRFLCRKTRRIDTKL